ncbi:MAG: discoidin domain-containing protein [Clostridiales bacterium]|nr:discoidin domain-containing protein [Clostridiales bacterium]
MRLLGKITLGILCGVVLTTAACASDYPSSGTDIPAGSALLEGSLIGETVGWNGQRDKGRKAAFDGDIYTYYDPSARSSEDAYCGVDLGAPYVLSKVVIMPRENWLDRFKGASIQGSNDMEEWETLWVSGHSAREWDWQEITDFDENTGYQYYRYWNGVEHGDVAEVELYGYPVGTAVAGPVKLRGEIIGEETGWDGSAGTGAAAAFDGDRYTYYDPTTRAADYAYAGIALDSPQVLSKVRIFPRENWTARFRGASIQGSDDMKNWVTLWTSTEEAEAWEWQTITDFEDNRGYQYYRYWNGVEHGDVAELEFYGVSAEGYVPPTMAELSTPVSEMKVSFDYNGGEGTSEPMTVTFGGTYGALPGPSEPDTLFEGWFTARTGGQQVTAETKVTHLGDHVLYAHWSPIDGPASDPETEGETEAAPAEQQTEPEAKPEQQPEEDGIRLVPIVCIAVSVLAIAAAAVVLLRNRDKDE